MKRKIGNQNFDFSKRSYIMGILNVTPDSFSESGQFFEKDIAIKRALEMIEDGADIIDVGGESTRPGSEPVKLEEEMQRVIPVIEAIIRETDVPVSIDTSKSQVAEAALDAGASMVNDVTGLRYKEMMSVVAENDVPCIIMHMIGEPRTMQKNPQYNDPVADIYGYLEGQANKAIEAGLSPENIYIDFGIGFGKNIEHNLELIRRLSDFKQMGYPVVYGPSRKSFIGNILDLPVDERLEGTAAAVAMGIANGADIVRVHDVKEMKRVAVVTERILGR